MSFDTKPRAGAEGALITRREKRVLRKLLYLEQFPSRLGRDAKSMTRLVNFNKDLIDRLKLAELIELSASVTDGRLDWHVRLNHKGRELAQALGAMRPVGPLPSALRRLEKAAGLGDFRLQQRSSKSDDDAPISSILLDD